jgi:hypothetical protein
LSSGLSEGCDLTILKIVRQLVPGAVIPKIGGRHPGSAAVSAAHLPALQPFSPITTQAAAVLWLILKSPVFASLSRRDADIPREARLSILKISLPKNKKWNVYYTEDADHADKFK